MAKHDWWLNVKEAEVDVDGQGTIIYTNGEVYLGKVTISDANGLGILSHESYETAGELHYRIVNDIKRSREKAKLAGVPYDAKRTRLELESVHGTMSLLFFDRDSVKCGETYLPLFVTKGAYFGDNRHDYIFQKWRHNIVHKYLAQARTHVNETFCDVEGQLVRPYDTARQQIADICWTPFDEARCQIEAKNAFDKARLDMVAKYALPGRGGYFTGYFDNIRRGRFDSHDLTTGIRLSFHDNLARIQIRERFDGKQKARQN